MTNIRSRVERMESAVAPPARQRIAFRVIEKDGAEEPQEAIIARLIASGEITEAHRDDVLIIRRVIVSSERGNTCT